MKHKLLILIVAYFAERTIRSVVQRIPHALDQEFTLEILILDDGSTDRTFARSVEIGRASQIPLKVTTLYNPVNQGYGGNQKLGYHYAIENGFDFVALLHGDGQYAPEMLPRLLEPLVRGEADAVFGSRMIQPVSALRGGMPLYKFIGNRILTSVQNKILGTALSEFHSGYRVYSTAALKRIPFERNSNLFHFDTEIIIQLVLAGMRIKELPIPTYYGHEICYVNGMRYAFDVLKASLQARIQRVNLFYDRRFDVHDGTQEVRYPSKLGFESSHSRIFDLVPEGARVLDLGAGAGAVGAKLKAEKRCTVLGCDVERGPETKCYDQFVLVDLDKGLPDFGRNRFDFILVLDVIEHLRSPEDFLDQLRALAAQAHAKVILTTANIGFLPMRFSLALGRFEYGKRGILDLTHTRLFTLKSLRRSMAAAGFEVDGVEGIPVPIPFIFKSLWASRALLAINRWLNELRPSLFGFQLLVTARARPTLASLLHAARASAAEKMLAQRAVD
jgi:glycosyltransferase involved in cell wall biosynthesis